MHARQFVARVIVRPAKGLRHHPAMRVRRIPQQAIALEDAVHQPLHHLRVRLGEPLVHRQHVRDDQQVAIGDQHLGAAPGGFHHFLGARRPAHAAIETAAVAPQLVVVGVARDEGVFVQHEPQFVRSGLRVEIAQDAHRHAGLLRQVADEELALVELRRGQPLAGQRVDRRDAFVHHDHVRAARVGDLHRHDRIELPAEDGERIRGGRRRREPPVVQLRPGLVFADGELHLEAILLRKERIRIRCEAAVGDNQAAVAGVFADVDLQDAVLRHVGCGGLERRRAVDRLDRCRRVAIRSGRRSGIGDDGLAAFTGAVPHHEPAAERQQRDDAERGEHVAAGATADSSLHLQVLHSDSLLLRTLTRCGLARSRSTGGGSSLKLSMPENNSR